MDESNFKEEVDNLNRHFEHQIGEHLDTYLLVGFKMDSGDLFIKANAPTKKDNDALKKAILDIANAIFDNDDYEQLIRLSIAIQSKNLDVDELD